MKAKIMLPSEMVKTENGWDFQYVETVTKKEILENGLEVFTVAKGNDYYVKGDKFIIYEKGKYSPFS